MHQHNFNSVVVLVINNLSMAVDESKCYPPITADPN